MEDGVGNLDRTGANAVLFGLLIALAGQTLDRLDWTPLWVLFWGYLTTIIAVASFVTWRRLRMPWATLAGAVAAIASAIHLGMYSIGWGLEDIFVRWPIAHVGMLLAVPALVAISHLREGDRWKEWRERTPQVRFRDMLRLRHLRDLRAEQLTDQRQ